MLGRHLPNCNTGRRLSHLQARILTVGQQGLNGRTGNGRKDHSSLSSGSMKGRTCLRIPVEILLPFPYEKHTVQMMFLAEDKTKAGSCFESLPKLHSGAQEYPLFVLCCLP